MTPFPSQTLQLAQTMIWTALPQGTKPGDPSTIRLAVLVSPQLTCVEAIGYRSETSTELATFPDWVNWPETAATISFKVQFKVAGSSPITIPVTADTSALQPSYWAAMFGAETTRVDSFAFEDFTTPSRTTFDVAGLHGHITRLYNDYATNSAGIQATAAAAGSGGIPPYIDPTKFDIALDKADLHSTINAVPANAAAYTVLNPPAALTDALTFHQAPPNNTSLPVATVPILDFHQAISSIGHFPEMLRAFGLIIPFEFTLPPGVLPTVGGRTNYSASQNFTVAVFPSWKPNPAGPPTSNDVSLATNCTYDDGAFLSTPRDSTLYSGGALNLATNPNLSFIDVDVDRAAHGVNNHKLNLQSTKSLHSDAPTGTTLPYNLPAIRGSGPSLVWTGWGADNSGLHDLASHQKLISTSIAQWLGGTKAPLTSPAVTLATEDLTRGWRIDVQDNTQRGVEGTWLSLHWRYGSYVFGEDGTPQITVNDPIPIEGMVTPAVSHAPTEGNAVPPSMFVHEVITTWSGWSLSAPRPASKQVNDDGSVTDVAGNPAVPTSHKDEYGNHNPQISATFGCPPEGIAVYDQGTKVGLTGLPPLRYGHLYRFGARAVDLGGWSIPQGTSPNPSPGLNHSRWEPVKSPQVAPLAPLTVGEGVHTIVLRDDGVTPAASNGRWIFPPRVHSLLAEHHGALDTPDGVPDPAVYATVAKYADGSLASIGTPDTTMGTTNIIVPGTLPSPTDPSPVFPARPAIDWLPDPASLGYALTFVSPPGQNFVSAPYVGSTPFTQFAVNLPDFPNPSPVFADEWIVANDPEGQAWPALKGKLLVVTPIATAKTLPGTDVAIPVLLTPQNSEGDNGNGKIPDSPDDVLIGVVPGSVYEVQMSSIFPSSYGKVNPPVFGLVPGVFNKLDSLPQAQVAAAGLAAGQVPQITPYHSMRIVYAVLVPLIAPTFSSTASFQRAAADTTVRILDLHYEVDVPTTSIVTYTASWSDHVDDPASTTNDPATTMFTGLQGSLVSNVADIYAAPVAQDPIVPVRPDPDPSALPFGSISTDKVFSAVHRIGDTKHHEITYTATATTRFGQFFAVSEELTLFSTVPVLLDARGVDVNLVTLEVQSSGEKLVLGRDFSVTPAGEIALLPKLPFRINGPNPPLSGTPLTVTYVPTDTIVGAPVTVHIPSTTAPPPIKVTKVAPAWKLSSTGSPESGGYSYTRTGNTLRVYMERPWYVTGNNEMVGVLAASAGALPPPNALTPDLPTSIDADTITLLALDPISMPAAGAAFSQTQLSFANTNHVPAYAGNTSSSFPLKGGNPVAVPWSADLDATLYNVWGYEPHFDSYTNQWYADIELKTESFSASPPPGYFLRLALARFQPYSISGGGQRTEAGPTIYPDAKFLSPITLVTYAQPVVDRLVTVVANNGRAVVTVSGPGYQGWRPAPEFDTSTLVDDTSNDFSEHQNSNGGGNPDTSTMVIEVQAFSTANGFSGELAWQTLPGVHVMTPEYTGSDVLWQLVESNGQIQSIPIPATTGLVSAYRLRISELDYFPLSYNTGVAPTSVDASLRRTFVAHIDVTTSNLP